MQLSFLLPDPKTGSGDGFLCRPKNYIIPTHLILSTNLYKHNVYIVAFNSEECQYIILARSEDDKIV